jgi:hypothetical protein
VDDGGGNVAVAPFHPKPPEHAEHADGHEIHVILDCCAVHRCDEVKELAETLGIHLPFIPPGLTDIMQPPGRSGFGTLKAEYHAVYRGGMPHREDKHMTKADFAAYPIPYAGMGLVSEEALHRGWTCCHPDTRALERWSAGALERELKTAVAP